MSDAAFLCPGLTPDYLCVGALAMVGSALGTRLALAASLAHGSPFLRTGRSKSTIYLPTLCMRGAPQPLASQGKHH